ncbi:MAG: NAD(P)H-dependent oxidoreductase [Bacteroidales bacterium]|nr:NAD(P)H-dependent oxidoreductase [Bacteroidales bacterium]
MKNILIINGHPRKESFNGIIAETYKYAAEKSTAVVKIINVSDLKFDAFQTQFKDYNASEDILTARKLIKEAEHIVWVYPIWWYSMPALLKAFIEQTFISGFAFEYLKSKKVLKWNKFLTGKTTSIISTMDAPPMYYNLFIKNPGGKFLKASMDFCGIKFKNKLYLGSVKLSTEEERKKWLKKVEKFGEKLK